MAWEVIHGEALSVLRTIPDGVIDSIVTDPPYGLGFMGKDWDSFRRTHNPADVGRENPFGRASRTSPASYTESERDGFVAFMTPIAKEWLRVLKPGGHVLAFGGSRTYHWMAWAIEGAGFEVRDMIEWFYGQGFPKSLNIAKAMDKAAGVAPLGEKPASLGMVTGPNADQWNACHRQIVMPEATTDLAKKWEGWGTALKPAHEPILLARKPLEGTVTQNVEKHVCGGINIDGCRVGTELRVNNAGSESSLQRKTRVDQGYRKTEFEQGDLQSTEVEGRFPANLILSHSLNCVSVGTRKVKGITGTSAGRMAGKASNVYGEYEGSERAGEATGYVDEDGNETVEEWACVPGCAVRMLDDQSAAKMHSAGKARDKIIDKNGYDASAYEIKGIHNMRRLGDTGGAARFFYCAKPSKSEKNRGCEDLVTIDENGKEKKGNVHPTVKPVSLMRYLCRLITPPGGVVLDSFCGSGSTGVGATLEGFSFAGIDMTEPYVHIARARIAYAASNPGGFEK